MKKMHLLLTLAITLILASSCEMNQLPQKTEALNKRCPIDLKELTFVKTDDYKVSEVKFDKKTNAVVFEVSVKEKDNEDDALKMLSAMDVKFRNFVFKKFNEYPEFKEFASEVLVANPKVTFHFKSDKGNKESEMAVPVEEFKAIADGTFDVDLGKLSLEALVEGFNSMLPRDLGDGVMFNGVALGSTNLQMNMTFDERDVTIGMFKSVLPQIKRELAKNLKDEALKLLVEKCIAADRGLTVSFHGGKSGQSADVEYSVAELKAAIK